LSTSSLRKARCKLRTGDNAGQHSQLTGVLVPVVEHPTSDPALNLKREADFMKTVEAPSFRVWRSADSVVLGKFLVAEEEVYVTRAQEMGVPVLRRPSGGGAVFHDLGNVNYSIYLPHCRPFGFNVEAALRALSFPAIDLLDHLGVSWSWEPPNNLYALGRKISGSAQARSGGRLLHHGTLLVSTDLEMMGRLLKPGGRSRISRVANLSEFVQDITVEKAADVISSIMHRCRIPSNI